MKDVQTLLAQYVGQGSETAFKEIVESYINFVYCTALRCVSGHAHLAQDVTQTVFTHLAQKAHGLPGNVHLGGWLHRDTYHVAATILRGERRRQNRERQAMETNSLEDHSPDNLARLAPVLDEAIDQLGPEDRTAILLRFFEQRDFRAVGEAMGSSENAAQKRVSRALDQLRDLLRHRGVALSTTALIAALTSEALAVAPPGLVAAAAGAALANAAGGVGFTGVLVKALTAKLSTAGVSVVLLASVAAPLLIQHQAQARLRQTSERLRQQSLQMATLMAEIEALSNLLARAEDPLGLPSAPSRELLRLRGEIGRLRTQQKEMTQLASSASTNNDLASKEAIWAQRVSQLKQWLEANPSENIPELNLLSEREWLNSMGPLDTADDYSKVMSLERDNAQLKIMSRLTGAWRRYTAANGGQIPTDLSQLTSFLDPAIDPSILQRYEMVPSTQLVSELQGHGDWVITQKAPVNAELDVRFASGLNGSGYADSRVTNRWAIGP
jgi:RNA polymerase sigma factor (sigma-70 family)